MYYLSLPQYYCRLKLPSVSHVFVLMAVTHEKGWDFFSETVQNKPFICVYLQKPKYHLGKNNSYVFVYIYIFIYL